ncbi:MAG: hypothetical protein KC656_22350 [Myxococcales bacterium]|nr:hypothetical protein [Myxococcales bacterium]MCB9694863.1 doxx family protein [Alphaproteobacteria bacterium]
MESPPTPALTPVRLALGLIYLHFGLLKLFPDLSSAEMLADQTVLRLHLGLAPETVRQLLALLECGIGVGFLLHVVPRVTLVVFAAHMLCTLLPLVLLPELVFSSFPFGPSLEGQYLLKNLVFLGAGWALWTGEPR